MEISTPLMLGLLAVASFGLAYLGSSVGLVLGQFRVPLLVWWLASPLAGLATSLAISTVGALVGAVRHATDGRVRPRLLLTVGVPSGLAAYAATQFAGSVDERLLEAVIGVVLVVSGGFLLRPQRGDDKPASAAESSTQAPVVRRGTLIAELLIGVVLGTLTAFSGLLLGTLRLPLLLRFTDTGARAAVGSNMAIGALTGLLVGVSTLLEGHVDLLTFSVLAPATLLGSALGARATGRMSRGALRRLIAVMLVIVGLWMAGAALESLLRATA